tara:strand:- start:2628 stop:3110 length:483 start_codon:yes stop_codon:yes gene_type:complete
MNKLIIIIIISNLFLISCNSVRDSAGVNRKVIDEYAVVENPPLVIPPDFNLLPPEQIETKDIKDTDTDLAKEILFGLEENNGKIDTNNSLMSQILKKTEADDVDENIRNTINQEFAGEKSSINDETKFGSEEEINNAIKASENTVIKNKKEKKKKRFFFF